MSTHDAGVRLHTIEDAAKEHLGGISSMTLRKHISQENVAVIRIGRRVFLSSDEIARIQRDGLPSLR